MNNQLEVCLTPALYPFHKIADSIVVVIDIFRATTTFCTALANGARSILPLASADETIRYKEFSNFVTAGERNGIQLEGFDLSNSPFQFIDNPFTKGKDIAFTTTNGTQALALVKEDVDTVVVGSFLNISVLSQWLQQQQKPVVLLCSGWKNTINYEDSLFAIALAEKLTANKSFICKTDTFEMMRTLYNEAQRDLLNYIYQKSERVHNRKHDLHKEFIYCLQQDTLQNIPILNKDGHLVNL